ncbi:hypothetical protein [Acetivibrio mesophilus]|uniref:Uncharacterized protein n=1 Tax=Acetivibrio mesophilus TaxID=2487273 RepID=A0A4Q0I2V8_9FIRM|nr:hypothetical protein [Acetivibrio mesophilus]RXE58546.1 hypothetical protein EFD62_11675 [Acetivibrio mesophilus]HHV28038.1 hypothetical protein [Clostridium sp.]
MENLFLFQLIKAFGVLAIFAAIFGFIGLVALYFTDDEEIMEHQKKYSTTIGNALLIMHSFFEPGKKPQTEQVIWVKKRRTPVERGVLGLTELNYDKIQIRGYYNLKGKRFLRKSGV